MRKDKKKKKKNDPEAAIINAAEQILLKSLEAAFMQAMEEVEKEWVKAGGTVSKWIGTVPPFFIGQQTHVIRKRKPSSKEFRPPKLKEEGNFF